MAPFTPFPESLLSLLDERHPSPETTRTVIDPPTLVNRQATTTVTVVAPGGGSNSGTNLSGGAIAGIVIGSIAGTLLLLWIIRSCTNLGAPPQERETMYRDVEPKYRHSSSGHNRHRHHSRRRSSSLSAPPPVVIRDYSTGRQAQGQVPVTQVPPQPTTYVYQDTNRGRGRSRRYNV